MSYISRTHKIPVVEQAVNQPTAHPPPVSTLLTRSAPKQIDLTLQESDQSAVSGPDTDSDIEIVESKLLSGVVINTCQPPQQAKRPLEQPLPRAYPNAKKLRKGSAQPSQPQKRPLVASSTSWGTPCASRSRPHLQQLRPSSRSPHTPDSVPSSNKNTQDSPQEQYQIKHNCLASALVALRQLMGDKERWRPKLLRPISTNLCAGGRSYCR
jgi:hypothetical protein